MREKNNRNSEKWLERELTTFVTGRGGASIKLLSTVTGLPDRLVLWPGGTAEFVELKSTGAVCKSVQRLIHVRLIALGFRCTVIDSEEKLKLWQNSAPGPTKPK